jgi:hypothetical protein
MLTLVSKAPECGQFLAETSDLRRKLGELSNSGWRAARHQEYLKDVGIDAKLNQKEYGEGIVYGPATRFSRPTASSPPRPCRRVRVTT